MAESKHIVYYTCIYGPHFVTEADAVKRESDGRLLCPVHLKPLTRRQQLIGTAAPVVITAFHDLLVDGLISNLGGSVEIDCSGLGSIGIEISGVWIGALEFDGTSDGINWTQSRAVQFGGTLVGGTVTNGLFFALAGGLLRFRIRSTAWTSGEATIYLEGTAATNAVTLANSLPTGINTIGTVICNAGTNLNTSLLALEAGGNLAAILARANLLATEVTLGTVHGHVHSIDGKMVSGTDIGDVTINNAAAAAAVNVQDGGNSLTVDGAVAVSGTLTQSTKHDAATYKRAYASLNADGNIVAGVANKVIKIHWIFGQVAAAVEGDFRDDTAGNIIGHFKFNDREGFAPGTCDYPMAMFQSAQSKPFYCDFTTAAQCYFMVVYTDADAS